MVITGRINWFGGQNNKLQRINDYGFIIPLGKEYTQDIYVHRDDVPTELQKTIEGRKGEGTYVQFEIDIDKERNRAVNIKLMSFIGTVEHYGRETWHVKCKEHNNLYFKSHNIVFHSEDVISFGVRYTSDNSNEVILIKKIDNSIDNQEIIEKCISSNNITILKKVFAKYLLSKSTGDAIEFTINLFKKSNETRRNILIRELATKASLILLSSSYLRAYLKFSEFDLNTYCHLLNEHLDSVDVYLKQELIDELMEDVKKASSSSWQRSIYWEQVRYLQENLDYKNFLWDIAPIDTKKQIVEERFRKFFEIVSLFNNSDFPYASNISNNWSELYKLNEIDTTLISKWNSTVSHNPHIAAQMISARGAEKLVMTFYEEMGYTVEDVSAHQVTYKSLNWKQGDISLNTTDLLDVKNARLSVNSKVYSEFCVPSFKKNRTSDVKIVGVLSPYLQLKYMNGKEEVKFSVSNPIVLGDFNKIKLRQLENIFSDRFVRINLSREFDPNNYLPHWLFDYDGNFYTKQLDLICKIQQLKDTDIPNWEDISIVSNCNPLPLFIAAKRQLPNTWLDSLPQWKTNFITNLMNIPVERISLPYLFLFLLRHFLSMLSYNASDYSPQKYKEILYVNSESNRPLKLYDPLNTIKDFCDSLQTLWENRKKVNLTEFTIFKFNGRGLLQAKRSESENVLTTILAYCGGWVDKKGKCGHTPLVIGKDKNCSSCGRLICPKENCGYCTNRCLSYEARKLNKNTYDSQFDHLF